MILIVGENKMKGTISVAELAQRVGVSRQSIYNRLTKDLSKFVKVVDGKKRLDIAVLAYLSVNEVDNNMSSEIDTIVKTLTAELDIKNKQIESLQQQVSQLTEALQNTTQSLMAAQALHASSVKQLESGEQQSEDVIPSGKKGLFSWLRRPN